MYKCVLTNLGKPVNQVLLAAVVSVSVVNFASAADQEGFYIGVAGRYIDSGVQSDSGGTVGFSAAELSAGYKHSAWIGGEVRLGSSVNEATSFDTEFSVPLYYSVYYRAEAANDVAKAYALLGFTDLEVEATNSETGITNTASDSGLSWGVGIGFVVNERVNLNFEYLKLLSNDDNEFDMGGVSLDFRF